jgi:hypothetical protein
VLTGGAYFKLVTLLAVESYSSPPPPARNLHRQASTAPQLLRPRYVTSCCSSYACVAHPIVACPHFCETDICVYYFWVSKWLFRFVVYPRLLRFKFSLLPATGLAAANPGVFSLPRRASVARCRCLDTWNPHPYEQPCVFSSTKTIRFFRPKSEHS